MLLILVIASAIFGGLGAYVASQKRRAQAEGLMLGALFGPLGCLIEACLPVGDAAPAAPRARRPAHQIQSTEYVVKGNVDREGLVAYVADRFRGHLETAAPGWAELPPAKVKAALKPCEAALMEELHYRPTEFSDLAAEARRAMLAR